MGVYKSEENELHITGILEICIPFRDPQASSRCKHMLNVYRVSKCANFLWKDYHISFLSFWLLRGLTSATPPEACVEILMWNFINGFSSHKDTDEVDKDPWLTCSSNSNIMTNEKDTSLHSFWEALVHRLYIHSLVNKKMKRQWQKGFHTLIVVAFELERFKQMRWRGLREINTSNLLYYTTLNTERQPHWMVVDSKCQLRLDPCDIAKWSPNTISVTWSFSLINICCTLTLKVEYHTACHMDNPPSPII